MRHVQEGAESRAARESFQLRGIIISLAPPHRTQQHLSANRCKIVCNLVFRNIRAREDNLSFLLGEPPQLEF